MVAGIGCGAIHRIFGTESEGLTSIISENLQHPFPGKDILIRFLGQSHFLHRTLKNSTQFHFPPDKRQALQRRLFSKARFYKFF